MKFKHLLILSLLIGVLHYSCKKTHSKTPVVEKPALVEMETDELSMLFIGDVMQHGPNIRGAYVDSLGVYDYTPVFAPLVPVFKTVDFSIANLELTLAGEPYTGYPQFSAPDELVVGLQKSGVGYLVTANNHSCDRHKKGIVRTIDVLDSLGIIHTGTFKDDADRKKNQVMLLKKNGITVAILNYTYGTNGIPTPEPTIVNRIDSITIAEDIIKAQRQKPDAIIVFMHWGDEYQQLPNNYQKNFAKYCFDKGANYIIGSHPHVLQPMERWYDSTASAERLVVYSLGNFISNQRERYKDGGAMFKLVLKKEKNVTAIKEAGYFLTWVDKIEGADKSTYTIYPVSQYVSNTTLSESSREKMELFEKDSHTLFEKHNKNIGEYVWNGAAGKWEYSYKKK